MAQMTRAVPERRVYLRGIALPLSVAEALIADARQSGDGVADALERALRDGRFVAHAPRTRASARRAAQVR